MNFYSFDAPHDFTDSTRSLAELLAAQAATALFLAIRQIRSDETAAQLERALTFRSVIDQAIGIVMGQQRCGPEEAFALLRAHSQNNNKKLRTVAEDLVTRTGTRRTAAEG
ncbi:ANTAR domain-containing protein [Nocardioides alcanivorans]|uniref:ANTAR domain-containing protein n=1 Tax=Nocardioides alcanivorans TaxID=2897352 RepID=UPI001F39AFC5|nr:ANTAR domain-containing protein [Nocardioides alcanivorans]